VARQEAGGQPVGELVKQLSEQATPLARQEVELLGGRRAAGRDHGPPEPGPFALAGALVAGFPIGRRTSR
jgi:hypothetical protein